jgi:hypothetical protein
MIAYKPIVFTLLKSLVIKNRRLLLISVFFLFWKFSASPVSFGQITLKDFGEKIQIHRKAVSTLSLAALRHFPTEFPDVNESLSTAYLAFHDRAKTVGLGKLQSQGYTNALTLVQRLIEFHGLNKGDLSASDRLRFDQVVTSLNDMEKDEKQIFFKKRKISDMQIVVLNRLEHIADVTDTGISRRLEMGIRNEAYDGERFLLREGDLVGALISHWLEDNYEIIIINEPADLCSIKLAEIKSVKP